MFELVFKIVALVISGVGAALALWSYRRSTSMRRAEWLYSLHKEFYQEDRYRRIRRVIDYEDDEYEQLREDIEDPNAERYELLEDLVDYLNFFEFLSGLVRLRQLKDEELKMLFEYYLNRLADMEFLRIYIRDTGFEETFRFLVKLGRIPDAEASLHLPDTRDYLFVYGTLLRGQRNSIEQMYPGKASYLSEATFRGAMFDVGKYPAVVYDKDRKVTGEVYTIEKAGRFLDDLDRFEESKSDSPNEREYFREKVFVRLENGNRVRAWVYLYNRATDEMTTIESGDYRNRGDLIKSQ